ncbi:MAG TPA: hypothetical protein VFY14_13345 [Streptomyces sp.]|nr:hypothetical protein [Streptomyces sp.]
MDASADLLTSLPSFPKQERRPIDLSGVPGPDSGPEGSCARGCSEAPLTSEPPLADVAPLTSERPICTELPLVSEPTGMVSATEVTRI